MNAFISGFITFAVFVTSLFGSFIAVEAPEDKTEFTPVLRFFAASDSHVGSMGDTQSLRMQKALKMAYAVADSDKEYNKLDAALFAGDLTDRGRKDQFLGFAVAAKSVLREETQLLAVIAKSHDSSTLGKGVHSYFSGVIGEDTDIHKVINGYHFIGLSVSKTEGEHYSDYQREWLNEQLAAATAEDPTKPVFVFQHEHVKDTVYGSSETDGWGLDVFSDVLSKYPQVVHISGHSHFPANDPRAIWQDSFTALNDGGLAYYELAVDGKNGQFPDEKDRMSQALIIEVDADNRVLVKVLDVDEGKIMREFLIDNITEKNKTKYSFNERKARSYAPVFPENAKLSYEKKGPLHYITVPQAKVSEDNEVFIYRISVVNDKGKTIHKAWEFSEYFFADMPESITFDGFMTLDKSFTVKVCAEDVWGNISEELEIKV